MKDALGHGSEARGSHSDGINKAVPRPVKVDPKALDVIRNSPNGFSVTPGGKVPSNGYMVAVSNAHSEDLPLNALSGPNAQNIVDGYAARHADALGKSGAHIGGWHDPERGVVTLDVAQNIKNKNAAIKSGVTRNQKAIYDVSHKRDISMGGTGKL